MKITVCQINNQSDLLATDWPELVSHVKEQASELVLLPEMPFYPWVAKIRKVDAEVWRKSVKAQDEWQERFSEISPAMILATRPVLEDGKRFNEAFIWDDKNGYIPVHRKTYLPDEEGFWEASWYDRGEVNFALCQADLVKIGFLICTELWFMQHARTYGQDGAHIIACPRATPRRTLDKWLAGGRAAAVVSGAFCISSNLVNSGGADELGGQGWVIGPDGYVLALTTLGEPFVSMEINLVETEAAKKTYPRYVRD